MNRRVLAAAFVATLVLPGAGSSQMMTLQDDPTWTPRLRLTPFIGYFTAVQRTDEWFASNGTDTQQMQVAVEVGGGPAVGMAAAMSLAGRWGVSAAAGYGMRDGMIFEPESGTAFQVDGNNKLFFGRAGVNLWLIERESELTLRRLNASVFAGGVVMHERPSDAAINDLIGNATHYGVNIGFEGELPFASDRFAIQFGVENNTMWFDETQLGNLAFSFIDDGTGTFTRAQTTAETDLASAWLLRAGISIRLR
jgi:hypothetical protein